MDLSSPEQALHAHVQEAVVGGHAAHAPGGGVAEPSLHDRLPARPVRGPPELAPVKVVHRSGVEHPVVYVEVPGPEVVEVPFEAVVDHLLPGVPVIPPDLGPLGDGIDDPVAGAQPVEPAPEIEVHGTHVEVAVEGGHGPGIVVSVVAEAGVVHLGEASRVGLAGGKTGEEEEQGEDEDTVSHRFGPPLMRKENRHVKIT